MKTILTSNQLEAIKTVVQEQARLRCIPTVVSLTEEIVRGESKLVLTSTPFNTVPVIHSEITLCDFGSKLSVNPNDVKCVDFFIRVSASYKGNGVNLFAIEGTINEFNKVYIDTINHNIN